MSQRQIDAAYTRSLKTTYKHLTKEQYRLVKHAEQIETNTKSMSIIERDMKKKYGDSWRRNKQAQQKQDYDLFFYLIEENMKLNEKISRIEDKYNLNKKDIMKFHRQMNTANCYGGSF